jgi:hypothetical protein
VINLFKLYLLYEDMYGVGLSIRAIILVAMGLLVLIGITTLFLSSTREYTGKIREFANASIGDAEQIGKDIGEKIRGA